MTDPQSYSPFGHVIKIKTFGSLSAFMTIGCPSTLLTCLISPPTLLSSAVFCPCCPAPYPHLSGRKKMAKMIWGLQDGVQGGGTAGAVEFRVTLKAEMRGNELEKLK